MFRKLCEAHSCPRAAPVPFRTDPPMAALPWRSGWLMGSQSFSRMPCLAHRGPDIRAAARPRRSVRWPQDPRSQGAGALDHCDPHGAGASNRAIGTHIRCPVSFAGWHARTKRVVQSSQPEDDLVVPLPYSRRVFASSWLVAITTGLAALHGQMMCCFLCFLVLFGTVNYWRDPRSGWRRRADFFFANFGIGYHLFLALVLWAKTPIGHKFDFTSPSQRPLFLAGPCFALSPFGFGIFWAAALYLYLRARRCAKQGHFDAGTKWHVIFHCVGNLANCLFYPGLLRV
ncbi:unnamed protein product [Durusdinium trenchii]|uniref:Uncharacterized protein n=1 Tax=Durusdinium trenchii TaxID=1381693 RepID=A0ABP0SUS0_9DINO